ncbi:glutaredoxin family protein [Thermodesulfobacteriota bacterium]
MKKVKMFSLSTCGHCQATKRLLDECDVPYEFKDVDLLDFSEREQVVEDLKQINPRCTFPTLLIGDRVIIGFKEKDIREALGLGHGY